MFNSRRQRVAEAVFWTKLMKTRKRRMKKRKAKGVKREQKKGRENRRRKRRGGDMKCLWKRKKHKPGSEGDRERKSWTCVLLSFVTGG
jgi:hypothetical protein